MEMLLLIRPILFYWLGVVGNNMPNTEQWAQFIGWYLELAKKGEKPIPPTRQYFVDNNLFPNHVKTEDGDRIIWNK